MRSLVLQLPDELYADAEQAAAAQGYEDMGSYVASLIAHDAGEDDMPLSEASLLAIEEARAEIAAGKGMTLEQVRADLAAHRAEWIRANPQ